MRSIKILEIRFLGRLALFGMLLWSTESYSQKGKSVNLLEFKYGIHFPSGDLKDRFGTNNDIGMTIQRVSAEKKIFFGVEGIYIFGNTVKEDVLALTGTPEISTSRREATTSDSMQVKYSPQVRTKAS
jgi:hypothetical protein